MKQKPLIFSSALAALVSSTSALAAEGGPIPKFISFYALAGKAIGLTPEQMSVWLPTFGGLFALAIIAGVGIYYKRSIDSDGDNVAPSGRFSLRFVVDILMDVVHGLGKDNCGKNYVNYLPILAGLFIYILVCNLSGLVPGFPPATETMDNNVAMGLVVFFVYNYAGLKEHGAAYFKQFLGPAIFIAPLFLGIEIFSHLSRPLSLGLRLTGNIFGDHMLLGVFTGLTVLVFPALLMFFGLLVSVVQSFVFTLLTGLYISMAISHDH